MLRVIQSNKMEVLAEALIAELEVQRHKGSNPFLPETILVQSPGMAQWLRLCIAEFAGISANQVFPLPSSYIWQLYQQHIPELPDDSAFTKDNMLWKLLTLLPQQLGDPVFAPIRDYLPAQTSNDECSVWLYQLCQKIADVFDQYLVYRPQWIAAWEAGEDRLPAAAAPSEHGWQPKLWRALVAHTQALGESHWHRANLHLGLLEQLRSGANSSMQQPLHIFGIAALPAQQLEVFSAIANSRDVNLYWLNPSSEYWGDTVSERQKHQLDLFAHNNDDWGDYFEVGNPLLGAWGKLGRDYQELLLNTLDIQDDLFVAAPPRTLLEHIQRDILQLCCGGQTQQDTPALIVTDDQSISVQACHSMHRELEVLQDHLLHRLNQDPDLTPGDILVMMPDVAEYAALIDGVMGAQQGPPQLPYAIADRHVGQESPLVGAFMGLMQLQLSRLTLTEVLDICQVPAVLARFEISDEEFARIRHWLRDAGVRWGWDGQDKQRWQLPEDSQNTWLHGLRRLLSGYAMHTDELLDTPQGPIAPYAHIEGQAAAALGKFSLFTRVLERALAFCQVDLPLNEKIDGALRLMDDMLLPTDAEQTYANQLREVMTELGAHSDQYAGSISQEVFASALSDKLTEKGVGQRFMAGAINFCTLMPMRSIPFKVIYLLGMNDADYPRQSTPVGFDLMALEPPQRGDRSRRMDDRYLFLEALLSARQQLYISYVARSARDNSPFNPSLLVSELLEYCQRYYVTTQSEPEPQVLNLVNEHPLQPFAPSYFLTQSGQQQSFQQDWLAVLQAQQQTPVHKDFCEFNQPEPIEPGQTLELAELKRFYQQPIRHYFRQRFQTQWQLAALDEDREPFGMDNLSRFHWLTDALQQRREPQLRALQAKGELPSGAVGQLLFESLHKDYAQWQQRLADKCQRGRRQEINLELATAKLQGWLDLNRAEQWVQWRPGKLRAKDKLDFYLNWLALCAQQSGAKQGLLLGENDEIAIKPIAADIAAKQLNLYVQGYFQGVQQPLLLLHECGLSWLKKGDRALVMAQFVGSEWLRGEGDEPHIQRVCPDLERHFDTFARTAEAYLAPLLQVLEDNA